jgi:hypothetical protein
MYFHSTAKVNKPSLPQSFLLVQWGRGGTHSTALPFFTRLSSPSTDAQVLLVLMLKLVLMLLDPAGRVHGEPCCSYPAACMRDTRQNGDKR